MRKIAGERAPTFQASPAIAHANTEKPLVTRSRAGELSFAHSPRRGERTKKMGSVAAAQMHCENFKGRIAGLFQTGLHDMHNVVTHRVQHQVADGV